ncbi:hypothetical protein [Marivivens sp. JLT3646]|uniref:hypothetical protein n=1 Tax=Marivivens sp. JLT3646 TaxID=1920883 RepID=UPI000AA13105|nr:hypothetical protein [Marivivens sp. JLT3646]
MKAALLHLKLLRLTAPGRERQRAHNNGSECCMAENGGSEPEVQNAALRANVGLGGAYLCYQLIDPLSDRALLPA